MFAKKKKKDLRKARAAQNENDSDENSNEEPDDILDTNVQYNWWKDVITGDDFNNLRLSNKMVVLFDLLKSFQIKGEKWYVATLLINFTIIFNYFPALFSRPLYLC